MKLYLTILISIICWNSYSQNNVKSTLKGELLNTDSKELFFIHYGRVIDRGQKINIVDGKFQYDYTGEYPSVGVLLIDEKIAKHIYLNPKDDPSFTIDLAASDSLIFDAANNDIQSLLEKFIAINGEVSYKLYTDKSFAAKTPEAFFAEISTKEKEIKDIISEVTDSYLKKWMTYKFEFAKHFCTLMYWEKNRDKLPSDFYDIDSFDINNPLLGEIFTDIEMDLTSLCVFINKIKDADYKVDFIDVRKQLLSNLKCLSTYDRFAYSFYQKYGNEGEEWEEFLTEVLPNIQNKKIAESFKQRRQKIYETQEKLNNLANLDVPTFTCSNLKGDSVRIADLKGKYILLDMWATWCGPCKQEIPHWEKKYEKFKEQVAFVSISFDSKRDKWEQFLKNKPSHVEQWFAGDAARKIQSHYMVQGYPTFILLGKDGKILKHDFPRPSDENFDSLLNRYIH